LVRATGESMIGAGFHPGDILVVDRSMTPIHGSIVIAVINSALTVKRLCKLGWINRLEAENPEFPPIEIGEDMEVWCLLQYRRASEIRLAA
jgi:DNA polymerase V